MNTPDTDHGVRYVCSRCGRKFASLSDGAGHLYPTPSWNGFVFCDGVLEDVPTEGGVS